MVRWRVAALVATFVIGVVGGGAAVRLLGVVDDVAAVVSLCVLAIAVIAGVVIGTRSRRLSTPYW